MGEHINSSTREPDADVAQRADDRHRAWMTFAIADGAADMCGDRYRIEGREQEFPAVAAALAAESKSEQVPPEPGAAA